MLPTRASVLLALTLLAQAGLGMATPPHVEAIARAFTRDGIAAPAAIAARPGAAAPAALLERPGSLLLLDAADTRGLAPALSAEAPSAGTTTPADICLLVPARPPCPVLAALARTVPGRAPPRLPA